MKARNILRIAVCALCFICVLLLPKQVQAAEYNGFTYEVYDGEVTITGCASEEIFSVDIPSTIEGYPVVRIGEYAFFECTNLTSITIPESVASIGEYAFYGCSGLTDVYISDIASWLNISFDGYYATPLRVNDNEKKLYLNGQLLTDVVIPEGVAKIPDAAFCCCSSLTRITIPESVTSIGEHAFFGCSDLTSIMIPNGVTSIRYATFANCSSLTSVTIPESVTDISSYVFYACSSLKDITIPDSVTGIAEYTFYGCSGLTSVATGNGVTTIGQSAFRYCSSLTSLTLGNSVTTINNSAFRNCSSLTSVTIPTSMTSIGLTVFESCNNLTDVYISDVASWLNISFAGYHSNPLRTNDNEKKLYLNGQLLTDLVIPKGIAKIPDAAFYYCSSLTSAVIPDGVTSIGEYAFLGCSNLTSIVIPDGVTSIGFAAFSTCSGLTSVVIPDSTTFIDYAAFSKCVNLQHVYYTGTESQWNAISMRAANSYLKEPKRHYESDGSALLPYAKTSCTIKALFQCTDCGDILIDKSYAGTHTYENGICTVCDIADVWQYAFNAGRIAITAYIGADAELAIPATIENYPVTSIGDSVFRNCSSLTSIAIPGSVTSIGENAFYECTGLTDVYYGDTADRWNALGSNCPEADRIHYSCTNAQNHWETITVAGNCEEDEYTYEKCACGFESDKTITVPALGHNMVEDKGYAATCTATGLTDGKHCTRCNDETVKQEIIPKLGHEMVEDKGYAATCTATGLTDGKHCTRCDDETVKQEVIPMLAHKRVYAVTTPPTESVTGELSGKCTACGDVENVTLPALNEADYTYEVIENPTEESTGVGRYTWNDTTYGQIQIDVVLETTVIRGDLDNNGIVDDEDVIYLLWHTLMSDDYPVNQPVDFDHNGSVDDEDVIYLLWHTLMPKDYPL